MNVNRVVVSDKVSCNNGKDWHYIVGYQVDEVLIPLFIKTPKNIFSYGMSQYDKTLPIQCHLVSLRKKSGCLNIKRFGMSLSHSCLKKWWQPIKGEGRYVHSKLNMRKEHMKTNFHGPDVPYDMYCNAMVVLQTTILSTNKVKIIIVRYMLKNVNILMQNNNSATCWVMVMMMMMDFSRCKKKVKRFL